MSEQPISPQEEIPRFVPQGRNQRVDALKFFAVVLVVVSHILRHDGYADFGPAVNRVITQFNMPLFFFLSGYVLWQREGRDPIGFILKKFKALMVPRYAWLAVYSVIGGVSVIGILRRVTLSTANSEGFWFLYILFEFFVVFAMVRRVSTSDWAMISVGGGMVVLSVIMPTGSYLGRDYWWLYPFLIAGYLVAKNRERLGRYDRLFFWWGPWAFALLIVAIWPSASSGPDPAWYMGMRSMLHSHGLPGPFPAIIALRYATPAAGIVVSWSLYHVMPESWISTQARMGRYSLGTYVVHGLFTPYVSGSGPLSALFMSALVVGLSLAVTFAIEGTPLLRFVLLGHSAKHRPSG